MTYTATCRRFARRGARRRSGGGAIWNYAVVLVLLAAGPSFGAAAAGLGAAELAGKKIFEEGASPSGGTIGARIGFGGFDVPASAVPCANCHGQDGLGRPEGGVVPPNIQWSELTKPYGHNHPPARKHPGFSEAGVKKAIMFGVDPAGNELDPAMPRYRMSDEDAASLVAYLKKIEFQLPAGVSATSLRIGTVLPESGRFAETGRTVRALIESSFDRINARGGLYGRKLELVVADYGDTPDTAYAHAWELISRGDVFVLLSPFSAGWEDRLARMAAEQRIPVVAPITLFPEDTRASNLYVFHLLSGVAELGQVLALHAAETLKLRDQPATVLYAEGGTGWELAQAFSARLAELGWSTVLDGRGFRPGAADLDELAAALEKGRVRSVFVLGPGLDVAGLARACARLNWQPHLFVPGPLAPRDILDLPEGFQNRVFLAYPTLPADQRPAALEDYAGLLPGRPLVRAPYAAQAYSATLATAEVLKQVGKDIDRRKFMKAFESLQGFDAGMLPPLSYSPDRRIGALGGYVVAVDLAQKQVRPLGRFVQLQ